jgi:hypothetical protein
MAGHADKIFEFTKEGRWVQVSEKVDGAWTQAVPPHMQQNTEKETSNAE